MSSDLPKCVGIIGSGYIGASWAELFVGAGCRVLLYDEKPEQVDNALERIKADLEKYEREGSLRGSAKASEQVNLVERATNLEQVLSDCDYIQECVFENLEVKQAAFNKLDAANPSAVLASSSSALLPSKIFGSLRTRDRCVVAHPINPPYFIPLVEIVRAPFTNDSVVERTRKIMTALGQSPVTLNFELPGFALNRVQYAILGEAWRLVDSGALSVQDVDRVMTDGLGPRYAFLGPLEVCNLNANGFADYCARYGENIHRIQQQLGEAAPYSGPTAQQIATDFSERYDREGMQRRRVWRDACLAQLDKLKRSNPYL